MAAVNEIQSFIQKFHQLCFNGVQASLNFSNYQGNVIVHFNANLGNMPLPHHYCEEAPNLHVKPTQLRRRKRRQNIRADIVSNINPAENLLTQSKQVQDSPTEGYVSNEISDNDVSDTTDVQEVINNTCVENTIPNCSNQRAQTNGSSSDLDTNDAAAVVQASTVEETLGVLSVDDLKVLMEELKTSTIQGIRDGFSSAQLETGFD